MNKQNFTLPSLPRRDLLTWCPDISSTHLYVKVANKRADFMPTDPADKPYERCKKYYTYAQSENLIEGEEDFSLVLWLTQYLFRGHEYYAGIQHAHERRVNEKAREKDTIEYSAEDILFSFDKEKALTFEDAQSYASKLVDDLKTGKFHGNLQLHYLKTKIGELEEKAAELRNKREQVDNMIANERGEDKVGWESIKASLASSEDKLYSIMDDVQLHIVFLEESEGPGGVVI